MDHHSLVIPPRSSTVRFNGPLCPFGSDCGACQNESWHVTKWSRSKYSLDFVDLYFIHFISMSLEHRTVYTAHCPRLKHSDRSPCFAYPVLPPKNAREALSILIRRCRAMNTWTVKLLLKQINLKGALPKICPKGHALLVQLLHN